MPKFDLTRLALGLALSIAAVDRASAQRSPPQVPWTGWARCRINVTGPAYSDQQTHTWIITGAMPTVSGAFAVYPATWSAVGGGSLQRTQGNQTLMAQWSMNTPSLSAPIAVWVRASDGRMFIQARHAQLRSRASVQGYQQLIINGKPQNPGTIASEAFEWAFPDVVVSRPSPNASLVASGSSTPVVKGSVGLMQPAGSQVTASCTWQFNQGAAPAPPTTLTAQAIPMPPVSGVATAQPPAANTPTCPTAPQKLVASAAPMTPASVGLSHAVSLSWAAPASGVANAYTIQAGSAPGLADLRNFTQAYTQTSGSFGANTGSYYLRVYAAYSCPTGPSAPSNEVLVVIP